MMIVTQLRPAKLVFAWAFLFVSTSCYSGTVCCCASERPRIELRVDEKGGQTIRLDGLSRQQVEQLRNGLKQRPWSAFFPVRVVSKSDSAPPALLGRYELARDGAVFRPRFSLKPGLRHVARFHMDPERVVAECTVLIPLPETEPTNVAAIYPSTVELPENLLRFYLQFSAPMRKGDIYRYIRQRRVQDPYEISRQRIGSNSCRRWQGALNNDRFAVSS